MERVSGSAHDCSLHQHRSSLSPASSLMLTTYSGPFGPISSGHLTLRAPTMRAIWDPAKKVLLSAPEEESFAVTIQDFKQDGHQPKHEVTCLFLTERECLNGIVLEVSSEGRFRRVAFFTANFDSGDGDITHTVSRVTMSGADPADFIDIEELPPEEVVTIE